MLIPFFDLGNHHIEGLKSQAGKPYCKARAQVCEVPINKSRESRKRSVADAVGYPWESFQALYTLTSTCVDSYKASVTFYKA